MSMNYGEDTAGIHFTWKPERDVVEDVLVQLEAALAPFEARPHWGKLHDLASAGLAPRYPRWADALALRAKLDPEGRFANAYTNRVLGPV
jgi:xylitol oxidase